MKRAAGTRLAAACAAAALALVPLAAAGPVAAAAAHVSVTITSISPDVAVPGKPVTVSGTVSNATADAVSGLSIQLRSSGSHLTSRGELTNYAAGNLLADSPVAGAVAQLPGPLAPGGTAKWTVSISAHEIGTRSFGVYPLAAEVDANGAALDTDRSFLPFWPGKSASTLAGPLQIAWVWPVIDTPHQAACRALLNNGLAASVSQGGRLAGLLAAGSTSAASSAHLTWAIDPGLLANVVAMTRPYRVGGSATCAGTTGKQVSAAAETWLGALRSVTARQDFFVTPYNDVDVAALTHQGMDADLTHAFNDGRVLARQRLGSAQRPAMASTTATQGDSGPTDSLGGIAWPADGAADYGVLGNLAVNGIGTVILDSTTMPPSPPVTYTPGAVTQTPDGVGAELHVALADDTLTQILGTAPIPATARSASSRATAAGASFSTEQRFLAETAMIAAEVPALRRSVVIAPPRRWDPAPGVAAALLSETVNAPWLSPVSLADLVTATPASGQTPLQQPPSQLHSTAELGASLLRQVRQLDGRLRLQGSILNPPNSAYLSTAVAAVESAAWRGRRGARQARRLLARVSGYITSRERLVKIIDSSQVTLGGQSGSVPVSISNKLGQTVTVQLRVRGPSDGRITIVPFNPTVTIASGEQRTIAVRVKAAAAGTTTLRLSLLTPGGIPLPGGTSTLTVDATHFGTLALVIIGIAVAVFVLTAGGRAFRRGGGPQGGTQPAELGDGPFDDANGPDPASGPSEPDTVVRGPATRDDRPEEPDEYASTPGWAEHP